jgi:hypothetical protein
MVKKQKPAAAQFPKTLHVYQEQDTNSDEAYLMTSETGEEIEDGAPVAVYELREIKTKRVTHAIE